MQEELRFGRWRLLPHSRKLLADDGPKPLGSRAFDLLLTLVEARGALVTKDELLSRVWPGTVVEENNIQAQMSALRRVFGPEAAQLIVTIPGRGYRFIGPVQSAPAAGDPPVQTPAAAPAPGAAPPAEAGPPPRPRSMPRRESVAVARFEAQGGDADGIVLARIFADELTAELGRLEELRILPAASAMQAAAYSVHGTVRFTGHLFRITAQLQDGAEGEVIWLERCDLQRGDTVLPDDILTRFAVGIDQAIARRSLDRARRRPAADLTPRELFLIGRDHHQRGTEADTAIAREAFDRAIAADPGFARAYAWQALTVQRGVTHLWGVPQGQEARNLLLHLARRAVELAPDLPSCLSRLAYCLTLHQLWDEAVDAARAALRSKQWLTYGMSRTLCSEVLAHAGMAEEAVGAIERTFAIDPLAGAITKGMYGRALVLAGRCEEAISELRWCSAQRPDYVPSYHSLVVAYAETGRIDDAKTALEQSRRLQPSWTPQNNTGAWFFRRPADLDRFLDAFRAADGTVSEPEDVSGEGAPAGPVRREGAGQQPLAKPPEQASGGKYARPDATNERTAVIAVHPFHVADGEPAATRLVGALRHSLIAKLSRFEDLRVAAMAGGDPASFQLRGEILTGRSSLRILVRLEDGAGATVLWAVSVEHALDGDPDLSGDTLETLCIAVGRHIGSECLRRARLKPPHNLTARELCLMGIDHFHRGTQADTLAAYNLFGRATAADPGYAAAYAWQAYASQRGATHGWGVIGGQAARDRMLELAQRAVQLEPGSPLCLGQLAFSLVLHQRWDEAVGNARAVMRSHYLPGNAGFTSFGEVMSCAGHAEEAVTELKRALSLDPLCPPAMHALLGRALLFAGRPEEALPELRWCAARVPDYLSGLHTLVVAAVETGRLAEARAAYRETVRLQPGWVPRNHSGMWLFRRQADYHRFLAAFTTAASAANEAARQAEDAADQGHGGAPRGSVANPASLPLHP